MTDSLIRGLIAFRTVNASNPALFHRPSDAVEQLKHLERPQDAAHAARLHKLLSRTTGEIEAVKANGGVYVPTSHDRVTPQPITGETA